MKALPKVSTTSTGPIVAPGMSSTTRVTPEGSSTITVAAGPVTSTSITTRTWLNAPPDVERDGNFQRWQRLK